MKRAVSVIFAALAVQSLAAQAGIANFEHVVLIIQENRTPDNLFYALCATHTCDPHATGTYDVQTSDWLDKYSQTGVTQPGPVGLAEDYKVRHRHIDFTAMCDLDQVTHTCKMDGAGDIECLPAKRCPPKPQFKYVDNSDGILTPYLELA
ncbi:MAG TPA: hypothetical protein VL286_07495, partial [Rhizomicrobium sp.]|nr:hypothetical protein [Rhizomicrobium sp.]